MVSWLGPPAFARGRGNPLTPREPGDKLGAAGPPRRALPELGGGGGAGMVQAQRGVLLRGDPPVKQFVLLLHEQRKRL